MLHTFLSVTTHVLLQRRRLGEMLLAKFALEWLVSCMHLYDFDHFGSRKTRKQMRTCKCRHTFCLLENPFFPLRSQLLQKHS